MTPHSHPHSGSLVRLRSIKRGGGRSWTGDRVVHALHVSFVCARSPLIFFFAFFTQSPEIKRVLTSQRTFDSEGEREKNNNQSLPVISYVGSSLQRDNCLETCRGGAVPELQGEGLAQRLG